MIYLTIYAVGVLIGLVVMRDPWRSRLPTALVWPVGPAAFILVVTIMLIAASILWPIPVISVAAVLAAIVWWVT